jgi:gliding motility-associated-like protein
MSPYHEYTEIGVYNIKLRAENEFGCADSLEKQDYVQVIGKGKIIFPNAFTPSLTGSTGGKYNPQSIENDVFYPYHEGVKEYQLEIYNRWGELIFESNDVNIGWDGYYKNKLVKQDVYVYKVKAMFYNGKTIVKAGDITLLHKNF